MNKPTVTYVSTNLFSMGIGEVVVARFKSGGRVEMGVFLVDVYCQGVKNAFFMQGFEADLNELLESMSNAAGPIEEHSGAWGRKLVESAVRYAQQWGISPHRDYKKAARVLGGIDPKDCPETFTFGDNGKPHLIGGPNDSEARCRMILKQLEKKLGKGNYHYTVSLGMEDVFFDDEDDDFEEGEDNEDVQRSN